jgi:predicted lactoylglutathione lyase
VGSACAGSYCFPRTTGPTASATEVDAFHAAALKGGGTDNGPPELRDTAKGYPPGYYAAFALDPDGNNIEVVFRETLRPAGR